MDAETLAVKLAETDSRARSNTRRIDKLEQDNVALNRLATSVEVMATKQDTLVESVEKLDGKVESLDSKVDTLEKRPAEERARDAKAIKDKIITAVISTIVGAVLTLLLVKLGIS